MFNITFIQHVQYHHFFFSPNVPCIYITILPTNDSYRKVIASQSLNVSSYGSKTIVTPYHQGFTYLLIIIRTTQIKTKTNPNLLFNIL